MLSVDRGQGSGLGLPLAHEYGDWEIERLLWTFGVTLATRTSCVRLSTEMQGLRLDDALVKSSTSRRATAVARPGSGDAGTGLAWAAW